MLCVKKLFCVMMKISAFGLRRDHTAPQRLCQHLVQMAGRLHIDRSSFPVTSFSRSRSVVTMLKPHDAGRVYSSPADSDICADLAGYIPSHKKKPLRLLLPWTSFTNLHHDDYSGSTKRESLWGTVQSVGKLYAQSVAGTMTVFLFVVI